MHALLAQQAAALESHRLAYEERVHELHTELERARVATSHIEQIKQLNGSLEQARGRFTQLQRLWAHRYADVTGGLSVRRWSYDCSML